jgi:hypothetical protein
MFLFCFVGVGGYFPGMSKSNPERKGGRRRAPAKTERGRQLLAALDERGLTLYAAAKKARLTFPALYQAIHGDPQKMSVRTVVALCERLGLPLSIVAPKLTTFSASSSSVA